MTSRKAATAYLWYLAFAAVPLAFAMVLTRWIVSVADTDSEWTVKKATTLISAVASVEQLPQDNWQTTQLPNFESNRDGIAPSNWYRIEVNIGEPEHGSWAIYLLGPSAKYTAFVNDGFVGESGQVVVPMPQHSSPKIFRFPAKLLHRGMNRIYLHSESKLPRGALQNVKVGPDVPLTRNYANAEFALTTLPLIIVVGLIAMGIVMVVLSYSSSREAVFGWYAIALFFMVAHIGIRLLSSVPAGDPRLWKNFVDIALIGYGVCGAFFINRHVRARHSRYETWFLYWAIIGIAVMVIDPLLFHSSVPWFFNRLWLPATTPIVVYHTWLTIRCAKDAPNIENRLLALLACVGIAIGGCDGLIGMATLSSTVYLPYAMGPVLCVFCFFLIRRFIRALREAEATRHELEVRVEEKTRALEESLVRMKDIEREQALSSERERIMRDVHDGIGAQLVQALSIVLIRPELKSIEEPLRGCLEELRLIVDSIEPVNGNLASVLGTLRMRMTRRLNEAAIQMRWRVDDIPILNNFGPSRVLHVSRIVHEAIANALKHSGAKQITLSARLIASGSQSSVAIEVADDGPGLSMDALQNGGRGIANMRRRAEELNAHLAIDSGSQGTTVCLVLPIEEVGSSGALATLEPKVA